jgi:methionine biosynthesis protein MetW
MPPQPQSDRSDPFLGILPHAPDPLRYEESPGGRRDPHTLLEAWIPFGARVLDVGAGTGAFAARLQVGRGARVVCLEPDPERAACARSRGLEVHEATVEEFADNANGAFDAVVLADVLEHVPYPAPMLRALHQVVAPTGRLLLSVPNVAHWTVRASLMLGRFDYRPTGLMDATHLRWFTLGSLTRLLEACGFRIDARTSTAGEWLRVYRSLPPWSLIPQNARVRVLGRLADRFPGAFALQHVIAARIAE